MNYTDGIETLAYAYGYTLERITKQGVTKYKITKHLKRTGKHVYVLASTDRSVVENYYRKLVNTL